MALALVVIDQLRLLGVHEVVLCPGSRSAPLAYALHAATCASNDLRVSVRLDERTAGFLALGLAKASQAPVAVVTTSGTAVANLHPAVVEADLAGVPLLLLTADRPPQARDTGANQTIHHQGIFGGAVRFSAQAAPCLPGWLPPEEATQRRLGQSWRALTARVVAAATGHGPACLPRRPGPVHLNLPFDLPLVPPDMDPAHLRLPSGWGATPPQPGESTLVVLGDAPEPVARQAVEIAALARWPVVAEPVTGAAWGALSAGVLLLGDAAWLGQHRPQRVLLVGRPTLDRATQDLLAHPEVWVEAVDPQGFFGDYVRVVHPSFPPVEHHGPPSYLTAWLQASAQAAAVVENTARSATLTGLSVALQVERHLAARAGNGQPSLLVVGSSSVVRDLQVVRGQCDNLTALSVVANRGAAGIDGMLSTAMGAALAHQRRYPEAARAVALVGDLTFVHDTTALMLGSEQKRPQLDMVVVNDRGGSIFARLEPGQPHLAEAFEPLFATPVQADLAALCAASGTAHVRVETSAELADQLAHPPHGLRVVEAVVDRAEVRQLHHSLREQVASALRRGSGEPASTGNEPR